MIRWSAPRIRVPLSTAKSTSGGMQSHWESWQVRGHQCPDRHVPLWFNFSEADILQSDPWRVTHIELLVLGEAGVDSACNPAAVAQAANEYALTGRRPALSPPPRPHFAITAILLDETNLQHKASITRGRRPTRERIRAFVDHLRQEGSQRLEVGGRRMNDVWQLRVGQRRSAASRCPGPWSATWAASTGLRLPRTPPLRSTARPHCRRSGGSCGSTMPRHGWLAR